MRQSLRAEMPLQGTIIGLSREPAASCLVEPSRVLDWNGYLQSSPYRQHICISKGNSSPQQTVCHLISECRLPVTGRKLAVAPKK